MSEEEKIDESDKNSQENIYELFKMLGKDKSNKIVRCLIDKVLMFSMRDCEERDLLMYQLKNMKPVMKELFNVDIV